MKSASGTPRVIPFPTLYPGERIPFVAGRARGQSAPVLHFPAPRPVIAFPQPRGAA